MSEAKVNSTKNGLAKERNWVRVCGKIEEELVFTHETFNIKFYKSRILVPRLSGVIDSIPFIVSEKQKDICFKGSVKGKWFYLEGDLRSRIYIGVDCKYHLDNALFVRNILKCEREEEFETANTNEIYLEGYLSKPPQNKISPFGRNITEFMLVVNGYFNKVNYIPCVAWKNEADYAKTFNVGDKVKLHGRIQSRKYFKKSSKDSEEGEFRTILEISVKYFERG